jgi:hypothetical protein
MGWHGLQQHQDRRDGQEQPGEPVRAHLHGHHAQHGDGGDEQVHREVVVGQPARHDEAQQRARDRAGEPQHAAAQRAAPVADSDMKALIAAHHGD